MQYYWEGIIYLLSIASTIWAEWLALLLLFQGSWIVKSQKNFKGIQGISYSRNCPWIHGLWRVPQQLGNYRTVYTPFLCDLHIRLDTEVPKSINFLINWTLIDKVTLGVYDCSRLMCKNCNTFYAIDPVSWRIITNTAPHLTSISDSNLAFCISANICGLQTI